MGTKLKPKPEPGNWPWIDHEVAGHGVLHLKSCWPSSRRRGLLSLAHHSETSRASEDPISIFCWSCSFLVKPTCISQKKTCKQIMQNLHYDWIMYTYMSQWGWQALPTINKCIGSIPNSSVIRINYYLFWSYAGLFKGVSKRKPLHGLFC